MVSARVWLICRAVRHHNRLTPTALTMIDASTRPEMALRMPMRMRGSWFAVVYRNMYGSYRQSGPEGYPAGHFVTRDAGKSAERPETRRMPASYHQGAGPVQGRAGGDLKVLRCTMSRSRPH